jgi:hypothetical protein
MTSKTLPQDWHLYSYNGIVTAFPEQSASSVTDEAGAPLDTSRVLLIFQILTRYYEQCGSGPAENGPEPTHTPLTAARQPGLFCGSG